MNIGDTFQLKHAQGFFVVVHETHGEFVTGRVYQRSTRTDWGGPILERHEFHASELEPLKPPPVLDDAMRLMQDAKDALCDAENWEAASRLRDTMDFIQKARESKV